MNEQEIREHAKRIIESYNTDYSYSLVYEDDELWELPDDDQLAVHNAMNKARVRVEWDDKS